MSSVIEKKERINRLKNYVNQISISDPSIKFDLISKIENESLTSSKEITDEIQKLEMKMKKGKQFRQIDRIEKARRDNNLNTIKIMEQKPPKIEKKKKKSEESLKKRNEKVTYTLELKNYINKEQENLGNTTEEVKNKAFKRKFNYIRIPELNIYHSLFSDIYFLYDYIPSGRRKTYKNNKIKLSEKVEDCVEIDDMLIDYKYNNKYEDYFTVEFLEAIEKIREYYFKDKEGIALLSIPPSKKKATPQTKKSIDQIVEWCKEDKAQRDFEIYNYYNLLTRTKDVKSSKEGDKRVEKHLDSIKYNEKDEISNLKLGFIILDDITTTGNTMYACRHILIENGHENKDIISLAIARTVNDKELLATNEGVTIIGNPQRVERC